MPLTHAFDAATLLPYADALTSNVEQGGVATLDPARTCLYIGIIKMAVEHDAIQVTNSQHNDNGRTTPFVPGDFTRKFNALNTLCNNLQFSDAWHHRVRTVSVMLAQQISMMNPSAKLEAIAQNARLPFLTAIAGQQARMFSDSTLTFTRPDIAVATTPGLKGALNFDPKNPGDAASTQILVSKDHLNYGSMVESLKIIWHEGLHGLHLQLAAMKMNGTISPGHKFYEDAIMLEAKLKHRAFITAYYPPELYYADVEERLCHASQDDFIAVYRHLDAARSPRPF